MTYRCQCPELGAPCPACGQEERRGRPSGRRESCLAPHHDEVLEAYQRGVSFVALGSRYGVTARAVYDYLKKRGLWQPRRTEGMHD